MPYLEKNKRILINVNLRAGSLYEYFNEASAQEFASSLNYLNFKLIRNWIKRNGKRYWIFALFVGTLVCCIFEVYRRIIGPYEDTTRKQNGDVR